MKLLLATTRQDRSRHLLAEAAERKGFEVEQLYYEDFKGERPDPGRFRGFDFLIPRDPFNTGQDFSGLMKGLIGRFPPERVLDFHVFQDHPDYEDKLYQHQIFKGVSDMPRYWRFKRPEDVGAAAFPLIVKKRISSRGKGIFIINNRDELARFAGSRDVSQFLIEEKIGIEDDIRILLIGHEIIGAVKRRVRIKANQGFDGVGVKATGEFRVPERLAEKAIEISRIMKSDFCGIDFAIGRDGQAILLESNVSPQFVALERVLGIDVAGRLMDFIRKKIGW